MKYSIYLPFFHNGLQENIRKYSLVDYFFFSSYRVCEVGLFRWNTVGKNWLHVFRNFNRDQKFLLGESGWLFCSSLREDFDFSKKNLEFITQNK